MCLCVHTYLFCPISGESPSESDDDVSLAALGSFLLGKDLGSKNAEVQLHCLLCEFMIRECARDEFRENKHGRVMS